MSLVSKFKIDVDIDLYLGTKFVIMGSLDKMQHVLEVKIYQDPVGRYGLNCRGYDIEFIL